MLIAVKYRQRTLAGIFIKEQQMAHVLNGNMFNIASDQRHGKYCKALVRLWAYIVWLGMTRTVVPKTLTPLIHLYCT